MLSDTEPPFFSEIILRGTNGLNRGGCSLWPSLHRHSHQSAPHRCRCPTGSPRPCAPPHPRECASHSTCAHREITRPKLSFWTTTKNESKLCACVLFGSRQDELFALLLEKTDVIELKHKFFSFYFSCICLGLRIFKFLDFLEAFWVGSHLAICRVSDWFVNYVEILRTKQIST